MEINEKKEALFEFTKKLASSFADGGGRIKGDEKKFETEASNLFRDIFEVEFAPFEPRPMITFGALCEGFMVTCIKPVYFNDTDPDLCVFGRLYTQSSIGNAPKDAWYRISELAQKANQIFPNFDSWKEVAEKEWEVKRKLIAVRRELIEAEEHATKARNAFYRKAEKYIKETYNVELKHGSEVGYHLVGVGEVPLHIKDFSFDDEKEELLVVKEIPGLGTLPPAPVHTLIPNLTS